MCNNNSVIVLITTMFNLVDNPEMIIDTLLFKLPKILPRIHAQCVEHTMHNAILKSIDCILLTNSKCVESRILSDSLKCSDGDFKFCNSWRGSNTKVFIFGFFAIDTKQPFVASLNSNRIKGLSYASRFIFLAKRPPGTPEKTQKVLTALA